MAKKRSARDKAQKKTPTDNIVEAEGGSSDPANEAQGDGGPMRGDTPRVRKKVVKQMRFLEKLQTTQRVLSARKTLLKKKRRKSSDSTSEALASMPELARFLPEGGLDSKTKKEARAPRVLKSAARQKIIAKEMKQLSAVLSHPMYQSDPFAAIKEHLKNTLPPPPEIVEPEKVVKKPSGAARKKFRKQRMEEAKEMEIGE